MTYFNILFLWGSLTVAIPILIALWNRKQTRRENFGGFYLLRQILQSTQKRIRLLEIIKLLNRIALIILLVLVFAEPLKKEVRMSGAQEGFAFILDVGRAMQAKSSDGTTLIELQKEKVVDFLKKIPSSSQGIILFLSDRCESMKLENSRTTATADQWLDRIRSERFPFANAPTTSQALTSCLTRIDSLFEKKEILTVLISPLPNTLDEREFSKNKIHLEILPQPQNLESSPVEIRQELVSDKVRMIFNPQEKRQAKLIRLNQTENLGEVSDSLDLPTGGDAWLWLKKESPTDPWLNNSIASIQKQMAYQVSVWALKESPGYLSLLSALRNYPDMKVVRQIGGEPTGDFVIVYGSYPYPVDILKRAWFFVDPSGQQPFKIRDQKQWSPSFSSADVQRAFHIQTQDGEVFVKKYALLDLDHFEILEAFQDGAPSLLLDKDAHERVWISPFDLEDLTTDLTLEATFIPYLYRHLEKWLSFESSAGVNQEMKPVWLLPGNIEPTEATLNAERWPGIYGQNGQFRSIQPIAFPTNFLKINQSVENSKLKEEEVSIRPILFRYLVLSLFIELLLCLTTANLLSFSLFFIFLLPSVSEASIRLVPISYFKGIDPDRKIAFNQMIPELDRRSNLDFAKPSEVNLDKIWESSVVIASSTSFGPFSKDEREKIRDYCERGGILFFDDPLATPDSTFYRSVKTELAAIFPGRPLKSVSKDDVLFRTFYLLTEVSGRKLASPYLEGIELDRRWVAVFSFNDLLGSQEKSANGDYAFSVSPYGVEQRRLATRLFLNIIMYSLAVDYKDDAIHLPYILKKRIK